MGGCIVSKLLSGVLFSFVGLELLGALLGGTLLVPGDVS